MNVTVTLQTILCAGVTHLVLPRNATELLARGGDGRLVVRYRVRLKPRVQSPPVTNAEGVPR